MNLSSRPQIRLVCHIKIPIYIWLDGLDHRYTFEIEQLYIICYQLIQTLGYNQSVSGDELDVYRRDSNDRKRNHGR